MFSVGYSRTAGLRGITQLIRLGGFIEETIKEELFDTLPKELAKAIEKNNYFGPGLWNIVEAAERALKCLYASDTYDFYEDNQVSMEQNLAFLNWYLEQTVRIETEKYLNHTGRDWKNRNLSKNTISTLENIPTVEEKVLSLFYGLNGDQEKTTAQIAALPEFQCEERYITKILENTEQFFNIDRKDLGGH